MEGMFRNLPQLFNPFLAMHVFRAWWPWQKLQYPCNFHVFSSLIPSSIFHVTSMSTDHHWTGGVVYDIVRHTAEDGPPQLAHTSGTYHHHGCLLIRSNVTDHLTGLHTTLCAKLHFFHLKMWKWIPLVCKWLNSKWSFYNSASLHVHFTEEFSINDC